MSSPESKPAMSSDATGLKRKRPAACVHCHQRKVRCDARAVGFPCSNCRSAGKTDCRVHEKKKRTHVRSIQHPVPIRCAPLPPSSAPLNPPTSTISPTHPSLPTPTSSASISHGFPTSNGKEASVKSRPTFAGQPNTDSRTDEDDTRELERQLISLIDEEQVQQHSIKQGVRVVYVGQDVSNLNFLFRQQHGDRNDEVYHFPTNAISQRYLKSGIEQVPREAFVLPDKPLADQLVNAYFRHVNPGWPIIDEDVFMTQYRDQDPANAPSILLLQAVLLVGAHVTQDLPTRNSLKTAFFRRAKILFEARVERNRDFLVQAALLMTWYSDPVDDDVAANAHFWVGVAARIATGLGMHRNVTSSRMVAHDKRMWRRAWWILVQFDVMVSLQHGRPQAINLQDCDVDVLTPADFEGCGDRVQIDYVIQYTNLCTMISSIMRERFGFHVSQERRKAVLNEADKALANWSLMLPDTVRMSSTDMDSWPALLHLTYNNFLILLHRPHPRASAYSDDYGPNDAEICSAAAGVIVSIFEDLRERDRIKYLWISSVNALFTAMIQVRVELRFSNPVLAINGLRRFDSTLASLRILADYWINAETILRLFESSKRLQHDLQVVKTQELNSKLTDPSSQPRISDYLVPQRTEPAAPTPPQPQAAQPQQLPTPFNTWNPGLNFEDQFKFPMQNQTPDPTAFDQTQPTDQVNDHPDWRQLFTIADMDPGGGLLAENCTDMENEWRELYFQDPGMTDYLNDVWLQG